MRRTFLLLLLVGCAEARAPLEPAPLRIAAASDLVLAFPAVGALYEAETGQRPVFSFGSSGLLAKQVEEGAPFHVFAAAHVRFVDGLVEKGRCRGRRLYGVGRLGIWSPLGKLTLGDLTGPRVVKIAIPNPAHAPYGVAAQQALEKSGLWAAVAPKLVYAENARQALQVAESGNAEAAFIPLALAETSGGEFAPIDPLLHAPLDQGVAACGPASPEADKFIELLMSDRGRAILQKYGFTVPNQGSAVAR